MSDPEIRDERNSDDELTAFPAAPDEQVLRVLVSNPDKPRTHEDFVERTDLESTTISDSLERLEAQGLMDHRGGRYFIPESRQSIVDGLLSDTRQLRRTITGPIQNQERTISEIDPQTPDAHILTLLYTNTDREYTSVEAHAQLDDALGFAQSTIENTMSQLSAEGFIEKVADRSYQAKDDRADLKRFATNMESAKRMFATYGSVSEETDEEAAKRFRETDKLKHETEQECSRQQVTDEEVEELIREVEAERDDER